VSKDKVLNDDVKWNTVLDEVGAVPDAVLDDEALDAVDAVDAVLKNVKCVVVLDDGALDAVLGGGTILILTMLDQVLFCFHIIKDKIYNINKKM